MKGWGRRTLSRRVFDGFGADGAVYVSNAEGVQIAGNEFSGRATDVPVALDLCKSVAVDSSKPLKVSTTAATDTASLTLNGPVTTVRK